MRRRGQVSHRPKNNIRPRTPRLSGKIASGRVRLSVRTRQPMFQLTPCRDTYQSRDRISSCRDPDVCRIVVRRDREARRCASRTASGEARAELARLVLGVGVERCDQPLRATGARAGREQEGPGRRAAWLCPAFPPSCPFSSLRGCPLSSPPRIRPCPIKAAGSSVTDSLRYAKS